jgi:FtsZ-binding cell division protein ZapB
MDISEEIDQFKILEGKIDKLIDFITALKKEKEALAEKIQTQEERLAGLTDQLENSRTARDGVKQRIAALLEKMDQIDTYFREG